MINEIEVYKAYIEARDTGESIVSLAKELGIDRQRIYAVVNKIRNGNETQLERCLAHGRYDCMWKWRYEQRFLTFTEESGAKSTKQLKSLVRDMHKDGFGVRDISRRIGKDPSTVLYYLKIDE